MATTTGAAPAKITPLQSNDSAIRVEGVKFAYSKGDKPVVDIPRWQLQRGEHVFVEGASGSGKSTFLNLLSGTLSPQTGCVEVLGRPFSALPSRKRDRIRAEHIGVVFQQFNLIPYLTVARNIEVAAYFAGKLSGSTAQRIEELFFSLQLPAPLLNRPAGELSVGQQQRVAIARALVNAPELLIVDEPTSALDAAARDTFMTLLLECTQSSALVFVSHDPSLARYFTQTIQMQSINRAAGARA